MQLLIYLFIPIKLNKSFNNICNKNNSNINYKIGDKKFEIKEKYLLILNILKIKILIIIMVKMTVI